MAIERSGKLLPLSGRHYTSSLDLDLMYGMCADCAHMAMRMKSCVIW